MTRDYPPTNRRTAKPRNTRVKPSRQSLPGWIWLVAGVLIGTLVTGIINWQGEQEGDNTTAQTADSEAAPPQAEPAPETSQSHKPRFDFYTLLKESEVIVPDENGEMPAAKAVVIPEPDAKTLAATTENLTKTTETSEDKTVVAEKISPPPQADVAATTAPAQPPPPPPPPSAPAQEAAPSTEVYVLQAGSFRSAADADSVRASLLLLNMHANIEKVSTGGNETWHRVLVGPFTSKAELSNARAILTQNGIDSIQLKRRL